MLSLSIGIVYLFTCLVITEALPLSSDYEDYDVFMRDVNGDDVVVPDDVSPISSPGQLPFSRPVIDELPDTESITEENEVTDATEATKATESIQTPVKTTEEEKPIIHKDPNRPLTWTYPTTEMVKGPEIGKTTLWAIPLALLIGLLTGLGIVCLLALLALLLSGRSENKEKPVPQVMSHESQGSARTIKSSEVVSITSPEDLKKGEANPWEEPPEQPAPQATETAKKEVPVDPPREIPSVDQNPRR